MRHMRGKVENYGDSHREIVFIFDKIQRDRLFVDSISRHELKWSSNDVSVQPGSKFTRGIPE